MLPKHKYTFIITFLTNGKTVTISPHGDATLLSHGYITL